MIIMMHHAGHACGRERQQLPDCRCYHNQDKRPSTVMICSCDPLVAKVLHRVHWLRVITQREPSLPL